MLYYAMGFLFFSNFLFFYFSIAFFFVLKNLNSYFILEKGKCFSTLNGFILNYASHFSKHLQLFFLFSKYFFWFVHTKNVKFIKNCIELLHRLRGREDQLVFLKMVTCAQMYAGTQMITNFIFKGVYINLQGKLSRKALSRKKRNCTRYSVTKNSDYRLKCIGNFIKLRTLTGCSGLTLKYFN